MLEVIIAVAIVAVLATLAAPGMYASYVRDQVVEGASLVDLAKKQVSAVWLAAGALPADNAEAGLPPPAKMVGNTVKSVTVDHGVINVVFGNKASSMIEDKTLSFRPAVVDDTPGVPIAWLCGHSKSPQGMTAKGDNRTDVPSSALPANCR
jgi:type IV pilus assembly protein PilA